jgi:hypothetical protein
VLPSGGGVGFEQRLEMTERGLPDKRARMGSLTSGAHRSVCTIMYVGFK